MLWLRIFLLFLRTNLILLFGLITTLQATEAQISRDQFLHVLSNAHEHDWDFETDRIDIEIKKVELESSIDNRKQEAKNYQLKTSSIQDYIQSIENEFEAYHSQLKAKVDFQKEFLKYDDLLDRLLLKRIIALEAIRLYFDCASLLYVPKRKIPCQVPKANCPF